MKGKRAQEVSESQLYALKLLKTPVLWAASYHSPLEGESQSPPAAAVGVRIGTDSLTFPTSRFSRYVGEGFIPYPLPLSTLRQAQGPGGGLELAPDVIRGRANRATRPRPEDVPPLHFPGHLVHVFPAERHVSSAPADPR